MVERALNKKLVKEASDTISHVQKDFGLDVFGFGEALHRKYPKEWKSWKRNWGEKFAGAEVRVTANVSVEDVGSSGPSLHLKESGIKK